MTDEKKPLLAEKTDSKPTSVSRRDVLKGVGALGAGMLSSGAATELSAQSETAKLVAQIPVREALEVLTAVEAATLEAICERLIPSDKNGPGAKEARAVHYIDHSLASHNQSHRQDYLIGLSALNDYARQTRGNAFYDVSIDVQNSILSALQDNKLEGFSPSAAGFFNIVRGHTIEGTFCDPYYGGNQQFVGWDMLRYPGIRLGASEADVAAGGSLAPSRQSAYEHATYTKMENMRRAVVANQSPAVGDDNA